LKKDGWKVVAFSAKLPGAGNAWDQTEAGPIKIDQVEIVIGGSAGGSQLIQMSLGRLKSRSFRSLREDRRIRFQAYLRLKSSRLSVCVLSLAPSFSAIRRIPAFKDRGVSSASFSASFFFARRPGSANDHCEARRPIRRIDSLRPLYESLSGAGAPHRLRARQIW
jgi:hypothetical protein